MMIGEMIIEWVTNTYLFKLAITVLIFSGLSAILAQVYHRKDSQDYPFLIGISKILLALFLLYALPFLLYQVWSAEIIFI